MAKPYRAQEFARKLLAERGQTWSLRRHMLQSSREYLWLLLPPAILLIAAATSPEEEPAEVLAYGILIGLAVREVRFIKLVKRSSRLTPLVIDWDKVEELARDDELPTQESASRNAAADS